MSRSHGPKRHRTLVPGLAGLLALGLAAAGGRAQQPAESGETLFTDTYTCYACHGYDGQTGQPRLVPLRYTRQAFITFVQNSPLPQMPAYPDVPEAALAAIYDYIQTIPADAPALDDVPVLKAIAERQADALGPARGGE
jgi:cytochrome c553